MNAGTIKLVSSNDEDDSVGAVAIMWLDNNRRFFVGDTEPATAEEPLYRVMWRQVAEQSENPDLGLVDTVLKMPMMIEAY